MEMECQLINLNHQSSLDHQSICIVNQLRKSITLNHQSSLDHQSPWMYLFVKHFTMIVRLPQGPKGLSNLCSFHLKLVFHCTG